MGRPLYSSAFRSTPAVRDPETPSFEKWSYLNAFDPDSDEFFDNENAVYEDFIGPVPPANPDVEDDEEREMLVVRVGNASPITSESSLSESDSLLVDGPEDPSRLVVDELAQIEDAEVLRFALRPGSARRSSFWETRGSQTMDSARSHPRRAFVTTPVIRTASYHPYPQRDETVHVSAPSAPIPVPIVSRRNSSTIDDRPSTPPHQASLAHISMSPPPSTTPRLYSWARNPSHSSSPSSTGSGPFTNPRARASYAHLSPAFIRIRDVTV